MIRAFIPNPDDSEEMDETSVFVHERDGYVALTVGNKEVLLEPEDAEELAGTLCETVEEVEE